MPVIHFGVPSSNQIMCFYKGSHHKKGYMHWKPKQGKFTSRNNIHYTLVNNIFFCFMFGYHTLCQRKSEQDLCRICACNFNKSKENKPSLFSGVTLTKVVKERVEFSDGLQPYVCSTCGSRIRRCRNPDGNLDVKNSA